MANAIKLYLDEQVDLDMARELRRYDIDVLTTREARRLGTADDEQLAYATGLGRVVFTQDDDFLRLDAAQKADRQAKRDGLEFILVHHPQVLGDDYAELVESLNHIADAERALRILPRSACGELKRQTG